MSFSRKIRIFETAFSALTGVTFTKGLTEYVKEGTVGEVPNQELAAKLVGRDREIILDDS
jgi:hypothetical protein